MKFALADERPAEEQRPVELLERLVEKGGLKQVDLLDCFGSQPVVSAVVASTRGGYRGGSDCRSPCSFGNLARSQVASLRADRGPHRRLARFEGKPSE